MTTERELLSLSLSWSWFSPQFWWNMAKEYPWLCFFVTSSSIVVASEIIYFCYQKVCPPDQGRGRKQKDNKAIKERGATQNVIDQETERARQLELRKPRKQWNTVLFFPDLHLNDPSKSVTEKLLQYLDSAKTSIHLCMYLTSNPRFTNIIRQKFDDGLIVQVVTDYDTYTAHNNFGPRIWRESGMDVRMKATGFLMHHKFAIIDQEALITGSLNWTKQGMIWNQENVLVTTNKNIVDKYMEEFYQLWQLFDDGNN